MSAPNYAVLLPSLECCYKGVSHSSHKDEWQRGTFRSLKAMIASVLGLAERSALTTAARSISAACDERNFSSSEERALAP